MTEDTTKPTLDEKYARAINSTDLRMVDGKAGNADLLAAFGISAGLGSLLQRLRQEYDQVAQDVRRAGNDSHTEAVLIFMHLKTLREAKNALGQYAMVMATKRRHMIPDREVLVLTGHTLSAWLDHRCRRCIGTGVIGGYDGKRQLVCRACGGTGNAVSSIVQNDGQARFCADLLRDMNQKAGYEVARDVAKNKVAIRAGKERISQALANSNS